MIPPFGNAAMRRILIIVLLALSAEACGSKGSLYLPPAQTPQQQDDHKTKTR